MSSVGAKLSRHVLGMKFMRKSKEQLDKSAKSNTVTAAAGSAKSEASTKLKNEPGAAESSSSSCQLVEELWSYNQCERYIMGRQSYGGFNPVVEKNLKKGVWRPFYLDNAEGPYDSSDEDEDLKKQSDVDVSDEEMAKTYGSLIGTLAKRFKGKRNKNKNKKNADGKSSKPNWNKKPGYSRNSDDEMESRRNIQKRQRESTGSAHWNEDEDQGPPQRNSNRPSPSKRRGDHNEQRNAPPQKRRKFWKPSD